MSPFFRPLVTLTFLMGLTLSISASETPPSHEKFTLAFGSCNFQTAPQPLWEPITQNNPKLWIWGGDIVYADEGTDVLKKALNIQNSVPGYKKLKSKAKILGVWDDHDYGLNNGGKENPKKWVAQQLMLDFFGVSQVDPRRAREGLYSAHNFLNGQVKVILLDARFHRERPGLKSDILGPDQWVWLENVLRNSEARVNIIVTGIQFLAKEHRFEKWNQFPRSRSKLLSLIKSSEARGVFFLSGDRHFAEISKLENSALPYPIIDFTSSGLTHTYNGHLKEPNSYRVGETYQGLNFGVVQIHLHKEETAVVFQVKDHENKVRNSLKVLYPL